MFSHNFRDLLFQINFLVLSPFFVYIFYFFLMLFFVNLQIPLPVFTFDGKKWQAKEPIMLLQVSKRLASILQQDDMVRLSDLSNAYHHVLPTAHSLKRYPWGAKVALSIRSEVLEGLLLGITAPSKKCNANKMQVLI